MYAYESGDEKREKQRFHCSGVNVFHISVEEKKTKRKPVDRNNEGIWSLSLLFES